MKGDMVMFYVPCENKQEAESIARVLLADRLIACANIIGPNTSVYEWEDEVVCEDEWLLLVKTEADRADAVADTIERVHSYDVPCVARIDASVNEAYEKWMHQSLM